VSVYYETVKIDGFFLITTWIRIWCVWNVKLSLFCMKFVWL